MEKNQTPNIEPIQLLTFNLEGEIFAVNIASLKEIVEMQPITPIPNSQDYIKGIVNIRGEVIVVVDLGKRLNLSHNASSPQNHIVITEVADQVFGVIVNEVAEVITINSDEVQAPPELSTSKIHPEFIKGVAVIKPQAPKTESQLIILIDLTKILEKKDIDEVQNNLTEKNV